MVISSSEFQEIKENFEFIKNIWSSYESRGMGMSMPGRPATKEDIESLIQDVIRWAGKVPGAEF